MKRFMLVLSLMFSFIAVWAQVTTWTSDHEITSDYIVGVGETLIIDTTVNQEPIHLRFQYTSQLIIYGSLLVYGSPSDSVYFTYLSGEIPYWQGIFINTSSSTCTTGVELNHAVVTNVCATGSPQSAAIEIRNPAGNVHPIHINHSRISSNAGYFCGGVWANGADDLTINNTKFTENNPITVHEPGQDSWEHGGGAINLYGCDGVLISECSIHDNRKSKNCNWDDFDTGGAGVCCILCCDIEITECHIEDNQAKGDYVVGENHFYDGMGGGVFLQDITRECRHEIFSHMNKHRIFTAARYDDTFFA